MADVYHFMPGRCCCGAECIIGEDDFDRSDGDSLGGNWDERSGDADIVSNQLKFITAGLVKFQTAHPDGTSGKQTIAFDFKLDATSSYARGVVCYVDDSNYLYGSVEQDSVGCWVLRVAEVSGGSTNVLGEDDVPLTDGVDYSANGVHSLRVCWDPSTGTLRAILTNSSGVKYSNISTSNTIADGDEVGLAGSANVTFDDFDFQILYDDTHRDCPECSMPCFIASDGFGLSDGTDIGCQWTELTGDFSISTSRLRKGTSAGIAKFRIPHPELDLNHYVEVDITLPDQLGMTVQNSSRVFVNLADSSNYHYAELKIDEGGIELQLSVGKNGTPLVTEVLDGTPGTYRLAVCWDDDAQVITASVLTVALSATSASTRVSSGIFVGLGGAASDGEEYFSNFQFWKHESTEEPNCPSCIDSGTEPCEHCEDDEAPLFWLVTITGLSNGCGFCEDLNTTFIIENDGCGGRLLPPVDDCGGDPSGAQVSITISSQSVMVVVAPQTLALGQCTLTFNKDYGADVPCMTLASEDIPFITNNGCDGTPCGVTGTPTCTVSAL